MALTASIDLTVKKPDFKGLKAEIQELTRAAEYAVQTFGAFSPEAAQATTKLAQAKEEMQNFNNQVEAANPSKFAQIGAVVSGLARGFEAAQGAMVLFGNKSEDVEKTIAKLQAAMALAEGIEGLGRVRTQLIGIANTIRSKVITAFSSLRGAIIASGLGALAIALGYVVANFEKVSKAITNVIPGLAKVGEIMGNLFQRFTDFIGVTSEAERQLESFTKATNKNKTELQAQIEILTIQGGKEIEIFKKRREIADADIALIEKRRSLGIKLTTEQLEEEAKLYDESVQKKKVIDAEEKKYNEDQAKIKEEKRLEHLKKLQDLENQVEDEKIKKRLANAKDEYEKLSLNQLQSLTDAARVYDEQIKLAKGNEEEIQKIDELYRDKSLANEAEFNRQRIALNLKADQQIRDAKLSIAQSTVEGLTALNDILTAEDQKRQNIQKAIALVEIGIDTAIAVSSLNAESAKASAKVAGILGPATPIFTAAYYAQGIVRILANVAKAKQVLSGGKASGGGGGGAMGINAPAMSAPNISSSLPSVSGFDTKVFVTEGDIRRTTNRVDTTRKVSVVK
jgi:uncharacterized phage-associated protein